MMRDPYPLEKGVEFLILTSPIRLHVKYFAIKLPFDKSLKVKKYLKNVGAFLKKVYPGILAKIIDEYRMTPRIICESKEIMADDALLMKKYHKNI